jgi:hypothetical protein
MCVNKYAHCWEIDDFKKGNCKIHKFKWNHIPYSKIKLAHLATKNQRHINMENAVSKNLY